ncbi:CPBP family intramembrane glutamic endopeptidase [Clostridium lundense]|uniref:CPBP family intramembrane glutamic endopeptidase n=1 Tax=Clostridium lundense TaxID=319475 RepID=UPI0004895A12|nr:CPBP family intramembrane glutamic endopeptidase [Clostridium lundense]
MNFLKNTIVFALVYLPPLVVFWKLWMNRGKSKILLLVLSILYLVLSLFTQNLLPFILVLICIRYMKNDTELYKDYYRYNFSIRNFNFIKALMYSIISYAITIIVSAIVLNMFSKYQVPIKDQEIVSYMTKLPLKRFIYMIPVTVIFAPILEEFIFRWLLFERIFKDRIGIYLAAVISSAIFSMVHFNIKSFVAILWIGLFNCFLIHKKGYWYAVTNHALFNSVSTFVLLFKKLGII